MSKRYRHARKWSIRLLVVVSVVLLLRFQYNAGYTDGYQTVHPLQFPASVTVMQDSQLRTDAQTLGLDVRGVNLIYSTDFTDVDLPTSNEIGQIFYPNTIHIKAGLPADEEQNIVAYEVLHYYWSRLPAAEQAQLIPQFAQFYAQSAYFRQLMSVFHGNQAILDDEMDSNICTRVDPSQLSTSLNSYCDSLIPNRDVLFPLQRRYD